MRAKLVNGGLQLTADTQQESENLSTFLHKGLVIGLEVEESQTSIVKKKVVKCSGMLAFAASLPHRAVAASVTPPAKPVQKKPAAIMSTNGNRNREGLTVKHPYWKTMTPAQRSKEMRRRYQVRMRNEELGA